MPLPPLPSSKTRTHNLDSLKAATGKRETSGSANGSGLSTSTSAIPAPASSSRKITPIGLARLKAPAARSTSSLGGSDLDSPSSPNNETEGYMSRRAMRKTVSIGSFPQPPKGGFGMLPDIPSSPESTPSLRSSTKENTSPAGSSRATSPSTYTDGARVRTSSEDDDFPVRSSSLAAVGNRQKKLSLIEERRASETVIPPDDAEDLDPPRSNSLAVTQEEHRRLSQAGERRKSVKLSIFPYANSESSSRRGSKAESLPLPKSATSPAVRQEDTDTIRPQLRRKSSSPFLRQGPLVSENILSGLRIKHSSPLLNQVELPGRAPTPPPKAETSQSSPSKKATSVIPAADHSGATRTKESAPSPRSSSRSSWLPMFKSRRTTSVNSTPKQDRSLHIATESDGRPSSFNEAAVTEDTHLEDLEDSDALTVLPLASGSIPRGKARPSDTGSSRSVRSTKSESSLRPVSKASSMAGKDMKGNVVVSVRVRPNGSSDATNSDWVVDNKKAIISYKGGEGGDFRYDNVFCNGDENSKVYDSSAKRLVRRVMEGYNGTVFAYGCTSTGKTFSMQGTAASPGIIPLAITDIFSYIREQPQREFLLRVSYLEIYNEKMYDLLSPTASVGIQEEIKLREDSKRGVYATPLKEEIVQSPTQLLRVIARGDVCRRTGSTQYNARSSRSHAVVQIVVESRARPERSSQQSLPSGVLVSTLSLIDLAGSERAAEDKERRKEGSHINKSLLTLGTIISRLSEQKPSNASSTSPAKSHLPFRDSKLTRLLSPALSGNALISILCTIQISPMGAFGPLNATAGPSESLNTLTFASRAKNNIVSHAKRNESMPGIGGEALALLDRYKAEIEELRLQLERQNNRDSSSGAEHAAGEAQEGGEKDRPQRTEEEERKWAERERESAERHETQMMEMQLARTALKERIGHLNRLILSSQSAGVNASMRPVRDRRAPAPDEVGVALGSPEVGRKSSLVETTMASPAIGTPRTLPYAATHGTLAEESEDDDDVLSGESGEASPSARIDALHADLRDKNRYIATLERRLLEARRTSSGVHKRRTSGGLAIGGWEQAVADRDREISELKARLDDAARMGNALRSAARRRDLVDLKGPLSIDTVKARGLVAVAGPNTAPSPSTTPGLSYAAHNLSVSSAGSRSVNFSRLTPVGVLSPTRVVDVGEPSYERPMDSAKSLRSAKSLEEMTRMLDGMIAQKVTEDVALPAGLGVQTVMQFAIGDAR